MPFLAINQYQSKANVFGKKSSCVISGLKDAFKLHDTYGFPIDLTRIMAEERGMKVDVAGYEVLMEKAKELARLGGKASASTVLDLPPNILAELEKFNVHPTDDQFKFERGPVRATVRAIWNGSRVDNSADAFSTRVDEQIAMILDKTNFYAEMGGQVGDSGQDHELQKTPSSLWKLPALPSPVM